MLHVFTFSSPEKPLSCHLDEPRLSPQELSPSPLSSIVASISSPYVTHFELHITSPTLLATLPHSPPIVSTSCTDIVSQAPLNSSNSLSTMPIVIISLPTNIKSIVIRDKLGIYKPKSYMSYIVNCTEKKTTSIKQTLACFTLFESMQQEFNALSKNKTWVLIPQPNNRIVIGSRWIFNVRKLPSGMLDKRKSRVGAQVYKQVPSFD